MDFARFGAPAGIRSALGGIINEGSRGHAAPRAGVTRGHCPPHTMLERALALILRTLPAGRGGNGENAPELSAVHPVRSGRAADHATASLHYEKAPRAQARTRAASL